MTITQKCSEKEGEEAYIECNVGQDRVAGEPQSAKSCEKCLYFDRCLASDHLCGLCYESEDKYDWTERKDGDSGPCEVDSEDYRVCEACP